jgi:4-hydroxybenzoate polyprenyltransferase
MQKLKTYFQLMRLDKPIGIFLLLWPTLWALLIAGNGHPNLKIVGIFVMGTLLMRSAGCVMNDIADMRYDGFVTRTKHRPLVSAKVTKKEAVFLAGILSLIAFGMVCYTNLLTIKLSFFALFLAASYPLTKRFFSLPQAYLGIAFGFGIPMAFAAILGEVPTIAWLLLFANVFWALAYDTEYAMVDREDDIKIGIRSSAITFGQYDVAAVMICYLITLMILIIIGLQLGLAYPYFMGIMGAGVIAIQHFHMIKLRNREQCFQAFLGNTWFGCAIFLGLFCCNFV